jgi:hypothetical protein
MEHRLRRIIFDAATMPTSLTWDYLNEHTDCSGFHESLLRSSYILNQVTSLLEEDIPRWIILDLIDLMMNSIDTSCANADKSYNTTPLGGNGDES